MIRCLSLVVATLAVAGCLRTFDAAPVDEIDAGPGDAGGQTVSIRWGGDMSIGGQSGRAVFDANVKPIMDRRCGPCHAHTDGLGPAFLKPEAYDSLVAYPGMITRDPTHSRLVTKGPHANATWFTDAEKPAVLDWLLIEAAALSTSMTGAVATPPKPLEQGANEIDLGPLGTDFLGASITFDATRTGITVKVTNLVVHARGGTGLHIVHPLFVSVRGGVKIPDLSDSLDGYDLFVPRFAMAPLGPALILLTNLAPNDLVSLAFQTITASNSVVQGGGCKAPMDFTQLARPAIQKAGCDSKCHGGMEPGAKNALDMSRLADLTPSVQEIACAQILNRVSPAMPAQSQIFQVTDPATMSNHKLRFTFPDMATYSAFVGDVSQWIAKEK